MPSLLRVSDEGFQLVDLRAQLIAELGHQQLLHFQGRREGQSGFALWARLSQVLWHG